MSVKLTPEQRAGLEREASGNGRGPAKHVPATDPAWPDPLREEAFSGLAGEIVRVIEPQTEADPAAVLIQLLVAAGNAAGRGIGFIAEDDFHATNLYAVLAGPSAKGRKGSSWSRASRLVGEADATWPARIVSGLSSGEGLIYAVRDPMTTRRKARKHELEEADEDGYVEEVTDGGESDKRLMVIEPEFASTLRVMARDGSTLSAIVRQAWESGNLRSLTKNSPTRATGAHVSLVAHITREELRRELSAIDAASGFGNRFLYAAVKRSKLLPEGGLQIVWGDEIEWLRDALRYGSSAGTIRRDDAARKLWADVYPALSEGKPGLLGAVTSRAEPQVMRLAVIYAMLDVAPAVRTEHLRAALAVWDYCAASAAYIFGHSTGDPVADEIYGELRRAGSSGRTRSELRDLFGRNKTKERLDDALRILVGAGLATCHREPTRGRPIERWNAISAHTSSKSYAHPFSENTNHKDTSRESRPNDLDEKSDDRGAP